VVLTCTGCVPQGLAFRLDDRLTITAPQDRDVVSLPVTITWEVEDFAVVEPGTQPREGAGYFAVFVDRAPVPPGETLAHVARDDTGCREDAGCPDAEYLAARGVHTTTATSLVLDQLPRGEEGRRERHTATIVLLDGAGRRLGESAFDVAFEVDRGERS
jgi:hypothetical protein